MNNNNPESLKTIALSAKALKNIEKLAWPKGARLTCSVCLLSKDRTPEEMQKYIDKWPRHCDRLVDVRPL